MTRKDPTRNDFSPEPVLRVNASHTQSVSLGTVYDLCVDRTGRLALSAGQDNGLVVWDVATGND